MAELKSGTTIGGAQVWTQGNFPLFPTGDTLLHKTFKVYTEANKPQAADNDFVSKAQGGKYEAQVTFGGNLEVWPSGNLKGSFEGGTGDGATDISNIESTAPLTTNVNIKSHWGLGIGSYQTQGVMVVIDCRNGDISTQGHVRVKGQVVIRSPSPGGPDHATRKDYVDALNTNTNNEVNKRVLKGGDTMTGLLTAPNFISNNPASLPGHLTRFDQVVPKGVVIDFRTY